MRPRTITAVLFLLFLLSACALTRSFRKVEESGFLGAEAAKLEKGSKDEPALVYLKPDVDWSAYDKMLLDPVPS